MKISQTVFKLLVGHNFFTKITFYNVQRVIMLKTGKQQLWYLCSAHGLIMVNISVQLVKICQNSFQVSEQTCFYDRQTAKTLNE